MSGLCRAWPSHYLPCGYFIFLLESGQTQWEEKGPYFKEVWQLNKVAPLAKMRTGDFYEIPIPCDLLSPIHMDNWELVVFSLVFTNKAMERSFYRKDAWLVKPDPNIFLAKIISYMSSGIGLWAEIKAFVWKNKLFFLSAPQLGKSLLKEVHFLFGQEFKLCSWTFHNRISFACPATDV